MIRAGDIIAALGSSWATPLVTYATRGRISHTAMVIAVEPVPLILEAVYPRVRVVPIDVCVADHPLVYLLEDLSLTDAERKTVIREACKYSSADYSCARCAIVGLDKMIDTTFFTDFIWPGLNPMCSWVVSQSRRVIGKDFGHPNDSTSPEDILSFAEQNPQFYKVLQLRGPDA